jgi:hypothetical protein
MPRGKTQRTLDLIDACREILAAIHPATVRAVCYQLFIRKLLPSMAKTCTNRVSTQLVYAREEDIIPWDWIVDETRQAERPATWAHPESYIPVVMRSYRRDRWELQRRRVEVWSEKGTVRGTLAPVLKKYGVVFRVMHGHGSATALFNAAEETLDDENTRILLYLGDWDPSGLHMSERDIPARLDRYDGEAELIRVALTDEDVDPSHSTLPSFPATDKVTDSRYRWFVKNYGSTCWELDALSPVLLRERVAAAIEKYIDWDAWLRCEEVEAAEQRSLQQILGTWRSVISGQASI